ncbi:transposase [Mesorhizobium sp. M0757]
MASTDLISAVTDAALEEVAGWQNRRLDACFPLVFFDAIRAKIRRGLRPQQSDLYRAQHAARRRQEI